MITLYLRYTINPNKLSDFAEYATKEQIPIRESAGMIVGYFLPTDFAGAASEAFGLIDFLRLLSMKSIAPNWRHIRSTNETPPGSRAQAPCSHSNGHWSSGQNRLRNRRHDNRSCQASLSPRRSLPLRFQDFLQSLNILPEVDQVGMEHRHPSSQSTCLSGELSRVNQTVKRLRVLKQGFNSETCPVCL